MAIVKKGSLPESWSAETIHEKLGGKYSIESIRQGLQDFGPVSSNDELNTFETLLTESNGALTVTTARETDPDNLTGGIIPSQPTGLGAQVPQTATIPVPQVSQVEALRLQQVMQAAGMLSNAQVLAPEAIGLMNAALSGVSTGYAEAANMALIIQQRREGLNPFVVTSLLLAMGIQPTGDFEKDLETLTAASQPKPDHADYMALLQAGNSSIDELIQSTYQRLAV